MLAFFDDANNPAVDLPLPNILTFQNWSELLERSPEATAIVLRISSLDSTMEHRVRQLRQIAPLAPIVIVVIFDRRNARILGRMAVDAVVWDDELPDGLWKALDRVASGIGLFFRTVEAVQQAKSMAPRFRAKLTTALEADPPYRTVKRWARTVGVTPRAIEQSWRDYFGSQLHARDFLGFVRALRRPGERFDIIFAQSLLAALARLDPESTES